MWYLVFNLLWRYAQYVVFSVQSPMEVHTVCGI